MRGKQPILLVVAASFLLLASGKACAEPIALPDGTNLERVDFERHVMGLLSRSGCNAGSCHGSFQGKGGLYLSLFGYSPEKDYFSFTHEALGRRVDVLHPDQSLMLLKPTGQVSHGGLIRFSKRSYQYRVLREWIAQGAKWRKGSGDVARLTVTPREHRFEGSGETAPLKVTAEFADGTSENVTAFSTFRTTDDYVADVAADGSVEGLAAGDAAIIVTYRGRITTARVLVPAPLKEGFTYPDVVADNYIDREIFGKLKKLNIVPSPQADDHEFLRRIYIDAIGRIPRPEEVRNFVVDERPDKRARKIDELLRHPMHAALWATKYSDITGNNIDLMENPPQLRPKRSKMWHDWLRARFERNIPYDDLVHGVVCATSVGAQPVQAWANKEVALVKTATEQFDTDYHERPNLDLYWRKSNFTLQQMAEQTAVAFMGVRIECAQCHKHPFDRWTQTDYRAFANIFSQVKFGVSSSRKQVLTQATNSLRGQVKDKNKNQYQISEVYTSNDRLRTLPELNNPSQPVNPRALGGPVFDLNYARIRNVDIREAFYQWLIQPDNPYLARSFVNRVWGHYFGVGLVDPVDDFSVANPPSNQRLLDALARDFVEHDYDMRRLERTILNTRVYQLSATPNETNKLDRRNYARAYPRRMMAEVMVDVLNTALGVSENFGADVPAGARAIEVAPNRIQNASLRYVFEIFGRPPRNQTCDCERPSDPALPQTLYLMTDQNLLNKINTGRMPFYLEEKDRSDANVVEELFLATLSRPPSAKEMKAALDTVRNSPKRREAFTAIIWALINTREFVLNH